MPNENQKKILELHDSRVRILVAIVISTALLLPLFPLPRPVNVSSIPWKAELAFSLTLSIGMLVYRRSFDANPIPKEVRVVALLAATIGLFSFISAYWATSWFAALHSAFTWLTYAALLVFVFQIARVPDGVQLLIRSFAAISLFLGILILFDFITLVDFATQEGTIRIRYAKFAEMLVTIAPVLFSIAIFKRSNAKLAKASLPGIIAWVTIMLSLSKGAFISGVIGFSVFFLATAIFGKPQFRKKLAIVFTIWLAVTISVQAGFTFFSQVPSTAEYISGGADTTRSTTSMRVYNWNLTWQMFKEHPIAGVGADNFGFALNSARASYAAANPGDPNNAIGEDYIFERAHSEPLQVMSELGVVGFAIFLAFALYAAFQLIRAAIRHRGRCSPVFLSAVAGCLAFAISSLFSSFSFRAFQNGVVFFVVLGLAFATSTKYRRIKSIGNQNSKVADANRLPLWLAGSAFCVLLLLTYSASKAAGHYLAYFAERASSVGASQRLLDASLILDPDLAGSYLALAGQAGKQGNWRKAAADYRKAIDGGLGISQIYSSLADAHEKNDDAASAEASLREGITIFPKSMFLRARLVQTLTTAGRESEARDELGQARQIDLAQANGWNAVLSEGIFEAHLKAQQDASYAKPPDLLPSGAVSLYAGGFDQLPIATP